MKTGLKFNLLALAVLTIFMMTFPSPVPGDELHEKGQQVFQEKACVGCHTIGGGKLSGPDLKGVTQRRKEEWIRQWLKSPDTMVFTDPIAKQLLQEYLVPMPNMGLTDEEIDALISYFKNADSENGDKD